jgi:hypothetical protein
MKDLNKQFATLSLVERVDLQRHILIMFSVGGVNLLIGADAYRVKYFNTLIIDG